MKEIMENILTEEDWEIIMEAVELQNTVNSKTGCTAF